MRCSSEPVGVDARRVYDEGVAALLDENPLAAIESLRTAVLADATFAEAWAALAVALHAFGAAEAVRASEQAMDASPRCETGRRDRQHVEVLCLSVGSQRSRAFALAREHLIDFPDDDLVRWLLASAQ